MLAFKCLSAWKLEAPTASDVIGLGKTLAELWLTSVDPRSLSYHVYHTLNYSGISSTMQTSTREPTLTTMTYAEGKVGFVKAEDEGVRFHPWGRRGGEVSLMAKTDSQTRGKTRKHK